MKLIKNVPSSASQITANIYCGLGVDGKEKKEELRDLIERKAVKTTINQPVDLIIHALKQI